MIIDGFEVSFSRVLGVLFLLEMLACSNGSPGSQCQDSTTLEICFCEDNYDCSCTSRTCEPGACISIREGAVCATSNQTWPACDPALSSQFFCEGQAMYECQYGYRLLTPTACSGVCVTAGGVGICAVSSEPWTACDPQLPSQMLCEGDNTIYKCRYGYRLGLIAPSRGTYCLGGERCVGNAYGAECVPSGAVISPACPPDGNRVSTCLDSTMISCVLGYVVDSQKCGNCNSTGCYGSFGSFCSIDSECAPGLVCHHGSSGPSSGICSAPCLEPVQDNPQCLAAEVDMTFPHSPIFGKCVNGWCGY